MERPDGSVGNRDPPGEALVVFPDDGLVVGISEERFAELDRLGALGTVLDGARSRVPDSRPPGAI